MHHGTIRTANKAANQYKPANFSISFIFAHSFRGKLSGKGVGDGQGVRSYEPDSEHAQ